MSKKLATCFIVFIFILGVGILSYPTVSNYIAIKNQIQIISNYQNKVSKSNEKDIKAEWEAAEKYNASLSGAVIGDPFVPGSGRVIPDNYEEILDVDGIMGYIKIPKIKVDLPIYHGCKEESLQKGVGHLEDTALPIGGKGNHCVLSGHRGLPAAELFTDLDKLEKGDQFYLYILDKILTYEVDQIKVISPDEVQDLRTIPDRDLVTLITCTPYGVNSHRLLVRGTRVADVEQAENTSGIKETEAAVTEGTSHMEYLVTGACIFFILLLILIFYKMLKRKSRSRRE